jgi:hypothetical protein
MPAFSPIVINDGADTPVAHTFVPNGKPNGVVEYSVKDGVPVGDETLTVSSKHGTREKISVRFKLPIVQSSTDSNGIVSPMVVRTAYVRADFDFSEMSTEAERKDAVAFLANLLDPAQTAMQSVLVDLEDVY